MSDHFVQAAMRTLVVLAILVVCPRLADAQALAIYEIPDDTRVNVDGMLRDWRGLETIELGESEDASVTFALAYDDSGFYFGGTIADERLIRTESPGRNEDAIVVTVSAPNRRDRGTPIELWLYAGRSGRSRATVLAGAPGSRPRAVRGAQIVEAPIEGGYVLEAFIPWRAIPNSRRWRQARAAVRMVDVDSEARPTVENEPATARYDRRQPERLPRWTPQNREADALNTFLQARGLRGTQPKHDLRGNVTGDARDERVVLVDRFVLVMGAGYREGAGFDFLALPISGDESVLSANLRDLTGDREKELVVEIRQGNERGSRVVWQVVSFDGQGIQPLFGIEKRKETRAGHIENRIRVRRGRRPTINVDRPSARGLDATSFREDPSTDAQPILLPWGRHRARSYRWNGSTFAMVNERDNPDYRRPYTEMVRPARTAEARPEPAQTSVSDDQRIAAARRARRIPRRIRERFRAQTNLAGNRTPETLVVLGKGVLVVGPAFRGGDSFFYFELPVNQARDITRVQTADLTGDGRDEILIYARQRLDGEITRTLLMVQRFTRAGFVRAATFEVAREQGSSAIENDVTVPRERRGPSPLLVRPGNARGWTAQTWPWSGSTERDVFPLLLPWRDSATRYQWNGSAFTPR